MKTNILIRRRAALGDVVMVSGIVRELYQQYAGNCNITVATDYPTVFDHNPYCKAVPHAWYDKIEAHVRYDLDDAYEYDPSTHFTKSYFNRVFGSSDAYNMSPELYTTDEARALVDSDIAKINAPFIAIHMRNWAWAMKNIPFDIWCEIISGIFETRVDHKIVIVGGKTDYFIEDHPLIIDARERYTPGQLSYFFGSNQCKCYMGIDSGPYHIAAASNVRIISLLTHNPPECIIPIRNGQLGWNTSTIQPMVDCAGCNIRQKTPVRKIECEKIDFPCNRTWDINKIVDSVLMAL